MEPLAVTTRTGTSAEITHHRPMSGSGGRGDGWAEFITHPGNELATGVVRMLAEGDTEGFSPLLLVGGTGTGKTLLLDMLVAETVRQRPEAVITRIDGMTLRQWVKDLRKFTSDDEDEGRGHHRRDPDEEFDQWSQMRESLRNVDLLIVDGLDDLAGQAAAIEELGHTIEALGYRDSAVVFTARCIPKPGREWPARFLSLIGAGLLVRMGVPDETSRRRYIMRWCSERAMPIATTVVDRLSSMPTDFGVIKGRLEKIRLQAQVEKKPIDADMLERLEEAERADLPPVKTPEISEVAKVVARKYQVALADLTRIDRHPGLVRPRFVAIWLANRLTGLSNLKIAKYFGGRDPATIRHAIRQVEAMRLTDFRVDEELEALKSKLV